MNGYCHHDWTDTPAAAAAFPGGDGAILRTMRTCRNCLRVELVDVPLTVPRGERLEPRAIPRAA